MLLSRTRTFTALALVGALSLSPALANAAGGKQAGPKATAPTSTSSWTAEVVVPLNATARPGQGKVVAHLSTRAAIDGGANILLVIAVAHSANGTEYVQLRLPQRPNTASGWVPANDVLLARDQWRIAVNESTTRVTLYKSGKAIASSLAVLGAPNHPTPTGLFAVSENVPQPNGSVLGPNVLALTAHSNVWYTFDGGDGRIGMHSYELLGAALGTHSSNGCIRLPTSFVNLLLSHVGPGTPVRVS